jgi:hypothetical protein
VKTVIRNTAGLIVKTHHDLKEKLAKKNNKNNYCVPVINSDWYSF